MAIKELESNYAFLDSALNLLDDLEDDISRLMLEYAEEYVKTMPETCEKKLIKPEDMKKILSKVLDKVKEDARFRSE